MDALYERCDELIAQSQATRAEGATRRASETLDGFERRAIALDDLSFATWTPPHREPRG